mmetsp:Transcript_1831/g.2945  ORF Transcript_1831/g.2945 Transcript_1831/m.2945 type:complete len:120 (-) Transcript_1831:22-381(-)
MNRAKQEEDNTVEELNHEFFKKLLFERDRKLALDSGEDMDLYLCRELLPVLIPGLEDLSREVERYMSEGRSIDPRIRARFNPCTWLAQYLMRNNPNQLNLSTQNYLKTAQELLDLNKTQ